MKHVPLCWKCSEAIMAHDEVMELDYVAGCKRCDTIKSYNDARDQCPLETTNVQP